MSRKKDKIIEKIVNFTLCGAIAIILMISAYFYIAGEIKLRERHEKAAKAAEAAQVEKVKEISCEVVNEE